MRNKMISIVLLVALLCTAAGCARAQTNGVEFPERPIVDEPRYDGYTIVQAGGIIETIKLPDRPFEDLLGLSSAIVQGYLLDDSKQDLECVYEGDIRFILSGATISTLVVTQVYEGDLSVGDQVPFVEPYYFDDASGEEILYHEGNYMPSIPGKDYVLFMSESKAERFKGIYTSAGQEYGRYPVISWTKSLSINSMPSKELGQVATPSDMYKEYFTKVYRRYM